MKGTPVSLLDVRLSNVRVLSVGHTSRATHHDNRASTYAHA
ncbi:hypothetical protein MINT15_31830 [Saccharomonospora viridis]|uniref:Uncharacterized protein n=1 Tax=Saccharomonospora viridis TaxID=1852 RepID=A0A837D8T1_9PSEU|nr:hypothetical protein MINT15_31830 [Saccharomonospora viridis]